MSIAVRDVPEVGNLVRVRDRLWVVADITRSELPGEGFADPQSLLDLTSIEDDGFGDTLRVIWEIEPGREVLRAATLPRPTAGHLDPPEQLDAFLDAVRWGAIASADPRALQAPFRSGITIEDYQLDPVVRALRAPRVNLLIADDVGLGKTIEAGLVVQELLLRHRARTVLVVCPASLTIKWRAEMDEKFGLEFRIVDQEMLRELRRERGIAANPWTHFPRLIVSIDWLKRPRPMALFDEILPVGPGHLPAAVRPADRRRGPQRRAGRTRQVRDRLAADPCDPSAVAALRAPAVPVGDAAQRLHGVVHRAARAARPAAVRPGRQAARPGAVGGDGAAAQVRAAAWPRRSRTLPDAHVDALEVAARAGRARRLRRTEPIRRACASTFHEGDTEPAGQRLRDAAPEEAVLLVARRVCRTLDVHRRTLEAHGTKRCDSTCGRSSSRSIASMTTRPTRPRSPQATEDALRGCGAGAGAGQREELRLLDALEGWARRASARPDAKAEALFAYLERTCRPEGPGGQPVWNDERVIVFTEYRDTQIWLEKLLAARGLGGRAPRAALRRHGP